METNFLSKPLNQERIIYTDVYKKIIREKWKDILQNLPIVLNGKIKRENLENSIRSIEQDTKDLEHNVTQYMIQKAVKYFDLYQTFERLGIEPGLLLLGKPEVDMKIIYEPARVLNVKEGFPIELYCHAEGFPKPTYQYFKNNQLVSSEKSFKVSRSKEVNSGVYECVITQNKKNGPVVKKFTSIIDVDSDEIPLELIVNLPQKEITVELGTPEIRISVEVFNYDGSSRLEFEWFKNNKAITEDDNPTYNSPELIINNFKLNDMGFYQCHVTRYLNNRTEKFTSINQCEVKVDEIPEHDLKIALLIGNGNYEINSSLLENCDTCKMFKEKIKFLNLNVYDGMLKMKKLLEKLGYLVIMFVDLKSDEYLRVIRFFRGICDLAESCSVFAYVAGHGFYQDHHDYLIPINSVEIFHSNKHSVHQMKIACAISSLANFFEAMRPDDRNKNIYIDCMWDLCRGNWNFVDMVDTERKEIDLNLDGSMSYSILYSCNIHQNGYDLMHDKPELNLNKGTIFSNLFLNNFKVNSNLYEIAERINLEIKHLKELDSSNFDKLSLVKFQSTCDRQRFHCKTYDNTTYKQFLDQYIISDEVNEIKNKAGETILNYYYNNEGFYNSALFFIELKTDHHIEIDLGYFYPIEVETIFDQSPRTKAYRILNIDLKNNLDAWVKITVNDGKEVIQSVLKLPSCFKKVYSDVFTREINAYIEYKRRINIASDSLSMSSASDISGINSEVEENNDY